VSLRFTRRWGPHRIAYHLGLARSTVGRVLARYGMPKLVNIDQATGLPVRKPTPKRYEVARPGQLIHVDIKKQGRIPDGGGWRAFGRGSAQDRAAGSVRDKAARAGAAGSRGYRYLHHAVDDNSRVAYSEILDDERKETAAGFWTRANAFFASLGVTVTAVMTDNGACYRSHAFADALGDGVKHKWTKPYRPQTNGKVERFNRTLAAEWAYAKPYASEAERAAAYETWLHHYNHHRPGEFNWSSQHLDRGGVQQWRQRIGSRRRARFLRVRVGSGVRIERCGRRCVRLDDLSPRGRCSGSSGV